MATLKITSGPAQGRSIECDRELVFGREGVDVVIDDDEMSRRHAAVRPGSGGTEVEDLGSLSGTFVDGGRITGKVLLTQAATIRMGKSELALIPAPPVGEAPADGMAVGDLTVPRARPTVDLPEPAAAPPEPVAGDRDKTTIRTVPPVQPPARRAPPPPSAGQPPASAPPPGAGVPGSDLPGVGLPGVGAAKAGGEPGRRRPARGEGLPPRAKLVLPIVVALIVAVIVYLLLR